MASAGTKWHIFYRVNSLSRVLEDALMKQAIPYQIARGTEFYARKEIKDVLSYLRVISNPGDNLSLERIINVPARALGDTSVIKIQAYASQQRICLLDACRASPTKFPNSPPAPLNAAKKLAALFDTLAANSIAATRGLGPELCTAGISRTIPSSTPCVPANSDDDLWTFHPKSDQDSRLETRRPTPPHRRFSSLGGIRGLMERVVKESGIRRRPQKAGCDGDRNRQRPPRQHQ